MSDVARLARRFGVEWSEGEQETRLRRHGVTVRLRGALSTADLDGRHDALCAVLGARFGLDTLEHGNPTGTAIQRVLPAAAIALSDRIAGTSTPTRPLVPSSKLVVLGIHEHGKLLTPAPASDDTARELFYRAYKLRSRAIDGPPNVKIARWEEPGGIAPSLASLLPDFDLDAAREGAWVLIPSFTELIVIRGSIRGAEARRFARDLLATSEMPLSRRLYKLTLKGLVAGEVVGVGGEFDGAVVAENLISVDR